MDPKDIPIRDLRLPAEISWWPLAPGWWVLIAIAVVGAALLLWIAYKQYVQNNARRAALRELDHLLLDYAEHQDPRTLGAGMSALLRRAALAYAPRSEVAGLTGEAWANRLNQGLEAPLFTEGAGRILLDLPYRNPATLEQPDIDALITAVRTRLQTPLAVAS